MNILRKYLLSSIPHSPDEPAVAEPVAEPTPEPVAAESTEPELALEPEPEPAPVVQPPMPQWALERIGEETNKRQAAEENARLAAERAQSYEEIINRMQADPAKAAAEPKPAPRQTDTNQAVQQEAARLLFHRDLQNVSESGFKEYGGRWDETIKALNAFGANTTDFVSDVMEIDRANVHKIMFQIAQDGERATALARMTPARRISEITRMVMAQAATAEPKPALDPKPESKPEPKISRAPAPKPSIAPHAAAPEVDPTTAEGNDKMDDKAWESWYKAKYMKRA